MQGGGGYPSLPTYHSHAAAHLYGAVMPGSSSGSVGGSGSGGVSRSSDALGLPAPGATATRGGSGGRLLAKTELCVLHFSSKGCSSGDQCQYSHSSSELRTVSLESKAKSGLIPSAQLFKSVVCQKFLTTGRCAYAQRCTFLHPRDVASLRDDTNLPFMASADDDDEEEGGNNEGRNNRNGDDGHDSIIAALDEVMLMAKAGIAVVDTGNDDADADAGDDLEEDDDEDSSGTAGGSNSAVVHDIVAHFASAGLEIPPMALRHLLMGVRSAEDYCPEVGPAGVGGSPGDNSGKGSKGGHSSNGGNSNSDPNSVSPEDKALFASFINNLAALQARRSKGDHFYLHLQAELAIVVDQWLKELQKKTGGGGRDKRGGGGGGGGGNNGGGGYYGAAASAAARQVLANLPPPLPPVNDSFFSNLLLSSSGSVVASSSSTPKAGSAGDQSPFMFGGGSGGASSSGTGGFYRYADAVFELLQSPSAFPAHKTWETADCLVAAKRLPVVMNAQKQGSLVRLLRSAVTDEACEDPLLLHPLLVRAGIISEGTIYGLLPPSSSSAEAIEENYDNDGTAGASTSPPLAVDRKTAKTVRSAVKQALALRRRSIPVDPLSYQRPRSMIEAGHALIHEYGPNAAQQQPRAALGLAEATQAVITRDSDLSSLSFALTQLTDRLIPQQHPALAPAMSAVGRRGRKEKARSPSASRTPRGNSASSLLPLTPVKGRGTGADAGGFVMTPPALTRNSNSATAWPALALSGTPDVAEKTRPAPATTTTTTNTAAAYGLTSSVTGGADIDLSFRMPATATAMHQQLPSDDPTALQPQEGALSANTLAMSTPKEVRGRGSSNFSKSNASTPASPSYLSVVKASSSHSSSLPASAFVNSSGNNTALLLAVTPMRPASVSASARSLSAPTAADAMPFKHVVTASTADASTMQTLVEKALTAATTAAEASAAAFLVKKTHRGPKPRASRNRLPVFLRLASGFPLEWLGEASALSTGDASADVVASLACGGNAIPPRVKLVKAYNVPPSASLSPTSRSEVTALSCLSVNGRSLSPTVDIDACRDAFISAAVLSEVWEAVQSFHRRRHEEEQYRLQQERRVQQHQRAQQIALQQQYSAATAGWLSTLAPAPPPLAPLPPLPVNPLPLISYPLSPELMMTASMRLASLLRLSSASDNTGSVQDLTVVPLFSSWLQNYFARLQNLQMQEQEQNHHHQQQYRHHHQGSGNSSSRLHLEASLGGVSSTALGYYLSPTTNPGTSLYRVMTPRNTNTTGNGSPPSSFSPTTASLLSAALVKLLGSSSAPSHANHYYGTGPTMTNARTAEPYEGLPVSIVTMPFSFSGPGSVAGASGPTAAASLVGDFFSGPTRTIIDHSASAFQPPSAATASAGFCRGKTTITFDLLGNLSLKGFVDCTMAVQTLLHGIVVPALVDSNSNDKQGAKGRATTATKGLEQAAPAAMLTLSLDPAVPLPSNRLLEGLVNEASPAEIPGLLWPVPLETAVMSLDFSASPSATATSGNLLLPIRAAATCGAFEKELEDVALVDWLSSGGAGEPDQVIVRSVASCVSNALLELQQQQAEALMNDAVVQFVGPSTAVVMDKKGAREAAIASCALLFEGTVLPTLSSLPVVVFSPAEAPAAIGAGSASAIGSPSDSEDAALFTTPTSTATANNSSRGAAANLLLSGRRLFDAADVEDRTASDQDDGNDDDDDDSAAAARVAARLFSSVATTFSSDAGGAGAVGSLSTMLLDVTGGASSSILVLEDNDNEDPLWLPTLNASFSGAQSMTPPPFAAGAGAAGKVNDSTPERLIGRSLLSDALLLTRSPTPGSDAEADTPSANTWSTPQDKVKRSEKGAGAKGLSSLLPIAMRSSRQQQQQQQSAPSPLPSLGSPHAGSSAGGGAGGSFPTSPVPAITRALSGFAGSSLTSPPLRSASSTASSAAVAGSGLTPVFVFPSAATASAAPQEQQAQQHQQQLRPQQQQQQHQAYSPVYQAPGFYQPQCQPQSQQSHYYYSPAAAVSSSSQLRTGSAPTLMLMAGQQQVEGSVFSEVMLARQYSQQMLQQAQLQTQQLQVQVQLQLQQAQQSYNPIFAPSSASASVMLAGIDSAAAAGLHPVVYQGGSSGLSSTGSWATYAPFPSSSSSSSFSSSSFSGGGGN